MSKANDPHLVSAVPAERQQTLSRRYDFASYAETRNFLDRLADLSKRDSYYPDVSFGKLYVNVSIDGEGQAALNERKSSFIADMAALAPSK